MRILLAVDGSDAAVRATKYVIALARQLVEAPDLHVVYADPPLMRAVAVSLGLQGSATFHAENAEYATRKVRSSLGRAGIAFEPHHMVADPEDAVLKVIRAKKIDLVVMGSHGRSAIKSALMGSVVAKVLAHCTTPLTIVR